MYRKLLSILLAALLLAAAAAGESAESPEPAGEPLPPAYADYTLVASSDTYDLFLFDSAWRREEPDFDEDDLRIYP